MEKLRVDRNAALLLKETQSSLGLSETELLEKFVLLAKKVVQTRRNHNLLYYYPAQSLKRLRQDQFKIFLEECAQEGLLKRYENKYIVDWPGKICIFTEDTALLYPAYDRAVEKIQRIYMDVLI